MEDMMVEMRNRILELEREVVTQRGANATLQATVSGFTAGSAATGQRHSSIDTRGLGKPETFDGSAAKWRDWKVVVRSYTSACNEFLAALMQAAEETDDPIGNAVMTTQGHRESSEQLAFIMVMLCRGAALDQVVNAGSGEGLLAWRSLCRRFEPKVRTRFAGVLLGLLNFDFSGDMIAKVEAFERELAQYERTSGEEVSDGIRVGVVLQRLEESSLKQHLLLNAERLSSWADFRSELINVRRAQQIVNASAQPMEVGALDGKYGKKGKKGGGKGKGSPSSDVVCHNCGRKGHRKADCWYAQGKGGQGGGKGDKGAGKGQNGGKSKDLSKVRCFKCGQLGHYAKDCRSVAQLDAGPATTTSSTTTAPTADQILAGLFITVLDSEKDVKELNPVDTVPVRPVTEFGNVRRLTVGVDSGAAASVVPVSQFADYPLEHNDLSRRGGGYFNASGGRVKDHGTRSLVGEVGGQRKGFKASAASVTKALASVADMVDQGHTVVFAKERAFAVHGETKEVLEFKRRNKVYEFDIDVEPYAGSAWDFPRQARP